jgi:hypothetical protein
MNEEITTVIIEAKVPFYSYDTVNKNRRACSDIKRWLMETLRNEAEYIPLYIEEDKHGTMIEDCTQKAIFKIIKGD